MRQEYLLEMQGISKEFPGVEALQNVEFNVRYGEIHALMGENGAGKSTLIKILTGIYHKNFGEIIFDGTTINPVRASEAQHIGISTIYQELNLIPYLSICENIFIGREPKKLGFIDWQTIEKRSKEILQDMGLGDVVDVKQPLYRQSVGIQQMVAIARAISIDAKLLVMDEPTSSLHEKEVKVLFGVIRKLKKEGISVIYISHRIDEVFEICDAVTVLKDGQLVGDFAVKDLTKLKLISAMIGRDAASIVESKKGYNDAVSDEVICQAINISKGFKPKEFSVEIKKGEVLGMAGLLGSGRTEFAKILFGDTIPDKGDILVMSRKVAFKLPRDAIKAGLAFCSEDRKAEGIIPNMSVIDNMTLVILPELSKRGIVSKKDQRKVAESFIKKLGIKTPSPDQIIKNLSGGNQQKVLLAKWLCKQPMLIILDEPTRGIDVGAKSEIEALIQDLSTEGISVLMISSEMEELIRRCDRIAVLHDGKKVGELVGEEISENSIMNAIANYKY
jgi:ABC-type sugar transport system ATPase subunit